MVCFIHILVFAGAIARALLKRLGILLILLAPIITGCGDDVAARREREHVNAMQRQVTEASREFITADAEARKGWVEAQQSFEQTRKSIVQQQTDIQSGLERLETERKSIVAERVTDRLVFSSIQAMGVVTAVLVPLILFGWLMQRFWQTESLPEVDSMIEMNSDASCPQTTASTAEIWQNLKPVSIGKDRYLPEVLADDAWSHDA